jgi:hypothetical protein
MSAGVTTMGSRLGPWVDTRSGLALDPVGGRRIMVLLAGTTTGNRERAVLLGPVVPDRMDLDDTCL